MKKDNGLKLRVEPTQQRAKETVALILDTAAQLLEEVGADALTTKRIAERASLRIRNVYRYFPNKRAVIGALAQRMSAKEADYINNFEAIGDPEMDLGRALEITIDSFFELVRRQPGILSIRKAMQSSPELKAIDEQSNKNLADQLSRAISKRKPNAIDHNLDTICAVVIDVSTVLMDRAGAVLAETDDYSKAIAFVDELKKMLNAYLSLYINGNAE